MTHRFKQLFLRQTTTLAEDATGVVVLFTLLFVGLTLSGNI